MDSVYKALLGYSLIALVVSLSAQALDMNAGAGRRAAARSDGFRDGPQPSGKGAGMGRSVVQTRQSGAIAGTSGSENRALRRTAASGDLSAVEALLRQGVDPSTRAQDKNGRTPLILASMAGHVDVVEALSAAGATVDDRDKTGHTALNWAAMRGRGQVASVLLRAGANINTQNDEGVSPLLYAVGTHDVGMLTLLVTEGADLEVESWTYEMTPVLLAVEHDDRESLRILLMNGADVDGVNRDGMSPLMLASEYGQIDTIRLLLGRGADVAARDTQGNTSLMKAAAAGKFAAVKELLEGGADSRARNDTGEAAKTFAERHGWNDVVMLLKSSEASAVGSTSR